MSDVRNSTDVEVFVTFNKEYVVAGRTCVGVRDRLTGTWEPVLPNRVIGAVPREERDEEFVSDVVRPRVGDRLCLQVAGRRIVTTPILAVESRARRA